MQKNWISLIKRRLIFLEQTVQDQTEGSIQQSSFVQIYKLSENCVLQHSLQCVINICTSGSQPFRARAL